MTFRPDISERLARARTDLRLGLAIVIDGPEPALVLAAETLTQVRFEDLLKLDARPVLAITARRAETLKARVYDGDMARISLPGNRDY